MEARKGTPRDLVSSDYRTLCTLTTLFSSHAIKVLIFEEHPSRCIHLDRFVQITVLDLDSANLHLINPDDRSMPEVVYPLDLCTDITKLKEEIDESSGKVFSMQYHYQRFEVSLNFVTIPVEANGFANIQALDFLLAQFTIRPDSHSITLSQNDQLPDKTTHDNKQLLSSQHRSSNAVARGLETTGFVLRKVFHSSGRFTGYAIKFLGKQYTSAVTSINGKAISPVRSEKGTIASPPLDPRLIAKAKRRKEWAAGFHSGARTATGAILYPVRWTGMQASKLARDSANATTTSQTLTLSPNNSKPARENDNNPVTQFLYDTVAGMGNGLASMCKGVTEGFTEIGNAISETAMYHATETHGEDYAQQITRQYCEASEEIGWASYKLLNVLAFGWQGLMIDAMVEGTMLSVALYDFLIGPVLLQQYMQVLQVPHSRPTLYYVVLRPWSISFYKSANDLVRKPEKIVVTAMLDTRPKLRRLSEYAPDVTTLFTTTAVSTTTTASDATSSSLERIQQMITVELSVAEVEEIPYLETDEEDLRRNRDPQGLVSVTPLQSENNLESVESPKAHLKPVANGEAEEEDDPEEEEVEYDVMVSEGINYLIKSQSRHSSHSTLTTPTKSSQKLSPEEASITPVVDAVLVEEEESDTTSTPQRQPRPRPRQREALEQETASTLRSPMSPLHLFSAASESVKRTKDKVHSLLTGWNGGKQSHIELCTVDCSTYLLYPPEATIQTWYEELQTSSLRVETIAKRKSGAEEVAMQRRFMKLPKRGKLVIELKRFIQSSTRTGTTGSIIGSITKSSRKLVEEEGEEEEETEEGQGKVYSHKENNHEEDRGTINLQSLQHSYFTIEGEGDEEEEVDEGEKTEVKKPQQQKLVLKNPNSKKGQETGKPDQYESFGSISMNHEEEEEEDNGSTTDDYFPAYLEEHRDPPTIATPAVPVKKSSRFSLSRTADTLLNRSLGESLEISMTPYTYNGVALVKEGQTSQAVPVMTIEEQLYQLQYLSFQLRNELTASELADPRTQQRLKQVSQVIDRLLLMKEQEKEMAEWEWRSWMSYEDDREKKKEEEGKEKHQKSRDRTESLETCLRQLNQTNPPSRVHNNSHNSTLDELDESFSSRVVLVDREDENNSIFHQLVVNPTSSDSYEFGTKCGLFATKDCHHFLFSIQSNTKLLGRRSLGKGMILMEDLRSLQPNESHELWIPILSSPSTSSEEGSGHRHQIGSLCLTVKMIPEEGQHYGELVCEKERLLSGRGGK